MGQAKQRGTFEERKATAEQKEVVVPKKRSLGRISDLQMLSASDRVVHGLMGSYGKKQTRSGFFKK